MYTRKYKKNNLSFLPLFLISIIVGIFFMLLGLYLGVLMSEWQLVGNLLTILPQNKMGNSKNILVLGLDSLQGVSRSDTIMLINLQKDKVGVLSIPRDTYLEIEGHGFTKINHAYVYGGLPLIKSTLSKFLQVPIDYYVVLKMNGVRQMVDQIGGIDIDVQHRLRYIDRAGDLYIDFKPGIQKMDGKQAMSYLRYRHDYGGDIGRISRQQQFAVSVASKLLSPLNILKLPKIMQELTAYVETDLSVGQMLNMAMDLKESIKKGHIEVDTLPGEVVLIKNVYYWKLDEALATQKIKSVLYGFKDSDTRGYEPQIAIRSSNTQTIAEVAKKDTAVMVAKEEENNKAKQLAIEKEKNEKELALTKQKVEEELLAKQKVAAEIKKKEELAKKLEQDRLAKLEADKLKAKAETERLARLKAEEERVAVSQKALKAQQDEERLAQAKAEMAKQQQTGTVLIEVLNGNGQNGIALAVSKTMKKLGFSVPKTGEAAHYNYQNTVLVDWKGKTEETLRIANKLHISPDNIITYYLPKKTIDVTLVVGKDWDSLGN